MTTADAPRPVVAAFDFDGTLTRGGSVWRFLAAVRGHRQVALAAISMPGAIMAAALLGGHHADTAKEQLFTRLLSGMPEAEVRSKASDFAHAHYASHARRDMARMLALHRSLGHFIVVVSASPELYLAPLAEQLGASAVLGTRLAVDRNGCLTGRYEGANCRGPEKAARLSEWIAANIATGATGAADTTTAPVVWAYGNSAGDLALLELADIGVDAGRLGKLGRLGRFPRLRRAGAPDTRVVQ
ncbi:MAG: HAD-IB family hydrolase [Acidimicrobiales bacterium]